MLLEILMSGTASNSRLVIPFFKSTNCCLVVWAASCVAVNDFFALLTLIHLIVMFMTVTASSFERAFVNFSQYGLHSLSSLLKDGSLICDNRSNR